MNEQNNRRNPGTTIDTICFAHSPKDHLRKRQKWGNVFDAFGNRRYYELELRSVLGVDRNAEAVGFDLTRYSEVFSVHAGYYTTPDEVCRLVNVHEDMTYTMVCHRFEDVKGTINMGEQRYEKFTKPANAGTNHRFVRQVNVATNEAYEHPDNSWIFEEESKVWCLTDEDGTQDIAASKMAMTWTINRMNADTYKVTFTQIPFVSWTLVNPVAAEMKNNSSGIYFIPPVMSKKAKKGKKSIKARGKVTVEVSGQSVDIDIDPSVTKLYEAARRRMVNKPRTPEMLANHTAWMTRSCTPGPMKIVDTEVDADMMRNITLATFWVDVEDDLSLNASVGSFLSAYKSDKIFKQTGGGLASDTANKLLDVVDAGLRSKDAKDGLLKSISLARSLFKR